MERKIFGNLNSEIPVYSFKLDNGNIFIEVITYGAILKSFGLCDGERKNIIGSFDTLMDYLEDTSFQGAIIGRVANRIEDARFTIDGVEYNLPKNDGENCLHGGVGFNTRVWTVEKVGESYIELSYYSEDGEAGFPGGLKVYVTYSLVGSALVIDYKAYPEKKTPIALTNHSYFNLSGMGGDIYSHEMSIYADRYTEVNAALIPTGERPSVNGTPYDLREPRLLGETLKSNFGGYNHNYRLTPTEYKKFSDTELGLVAKVTCGNTCLSMYTNMRDLQFYSGNNMTGYPDFSGGVKRINHGAFCLEAQTEPNAVNSGQAIYDKGEIYRQTTVYKLEKIKDN